MELQAKIRKIVDDAFLCRHSVSSVDGITRLICAEAIAAQSDAAAYRFGKAEGLQLAADWLRRQGHAMLAEKIENGEVW